GHAIEFALKSELARKRFLQRAAAPYGDGGFAAEAVAEVNFADGVLDLFDRYVIDQRYFGLGLNVNFPKCRKDARDIFKSAVEHDFGRGQHGPVRIDAAHAAKLLAIEQQFLFELDLVVPRGHRTHVNPGRVTQVRAAVLDSQLVIRARPSLFIKGALSKNEVVVVQVEVRGVIKQHLANLAVERVVSHVNLEVEFLHGRVHRVPELHEALFVGETIGLQQNLVLTVVDYIVRQMLGFRMFAQVLIHRDLGVC